MTTTPVLEADMRPVELVMLPPVLALDAEPGCVVVAHDESGVTSALAAGEHVILLDVDQALHAGVVTALSVRDGRLFYTIRQGVRLPPDIARRRIEGLRTEPTGEAISEDDLLDLLGELRDDDQS